MGTGTERLKMSCEGNWCKALKPLKLSVGVTSDAYLLDIEGLLTQGSRRGRTVGESVGGVFEMESSDWSNGIHIHHHIFDTRPDTEFKLSHQPHRWCSARWIQYTHVSLKVTNMSGDPASRGSHCPLLSST